MCLLLSHSIAGTGLDYPKPAKTLLQILVEELSKRGGWPIDVTHIGQDYDRELMFYGRGQLRTGIILDDLAVDHRRRGEINGGVNITRDQYETALAFVRSHEGAKIENLRIEDGELKCEFTPVPPAQYIKIDAKIVDADGWIEWAGGKCPVPQGTLVDVRHRDGDFGYQCLAGTHDKLGEGIALAYRWTHRGTKSDIIAYRLHTPQGEAEHAHKGGVCGHVTTAPDASSRANDDRLAQVVTQMQSKGPLTQDDFAQAGITEADDEADLNDCISQAVPIPARWPLLADIHAAGIAIDLESAVFLADYLVDAGYRKQ